VRELLPVFGADLVNERVVVDRNRITGAGVTAGIDFGLRMAARLRDEPYAEMLQLAFEYDPRAAVSCRAS
jgi:cyclohexyl-isocyanide hydratase